MLKIAKQFISAMTSLFLIALSTGILTTSQTVWLHREHYSSLVVAIVVSSYYAGFLYAAFKSEKFIVRISHIRAYAFFAALLSSSILLQGVFTDPWVWLVLRLIAGFCTAGLFIVVESWLLCQSEPKMRGQILALYMVVYYAAVALSQFLLNLGVENLLRLFVIATIFSTLSIIPLAITKVAQPTFDVPSDLHFKSLMKQAPSGVMGCFFAGLILGPIYGLLPQYFADKFHNNHLIALFMFIVIAGGMFFQIPYGKLSDRMGRKIVLIGVFVVLLIMSILMLFTISNMPIVYTILFLFGGAAFAIYPISMSFACDVLDTKDMVSAAQGLVFANSLGMILGPLFASLFNSTFSVEHGLIIYFILISMAMIAFFSWRQQVGITENAEDRSDFVAMARTTPITVEIDPRVNDEVTPKRTGE